MKTVATVNLLATIEDIPSDWEAEQTGRVRIGDTIIWESKDFSYHSDVNDVVVAFAAHLKNVLSRSDTAKVYG